MRLAEYSDKPCGAGFSRLQPAAWLQPASHRFLRAVPAGLKSRAGLFSPANKPRPRRRICLQKLKQPLRHLEASRIRRVCAVGVDIIGARIAQAVLVRSGPVGPQIRSPGAPRSANRSLGGIVIQLWLAGDLIGDQPFARESAFI